MKIVAPVPLQVREVRAILITWDNTDHHDERPLPSSGPSIMDATASAVRRVRSQSSCRTATWPLQPNTQTGYHRINRRRSSARPPVALYPRPTCHQRTQRPTASHSLEKTHLTPLPWKATLYSSMSL